MSKLIAEETKYMANPERRIREGLKIDKYAAEVQEFTELSKRLDMQPKEFWLPYADETIYVRCSRERTKIPIVVILSHDRDFGKVHTYATKHPDRSAMIMSMPSKEEIQQQDKR